MQPTVITDETSAPAPAQRDNMLGICHAIGEDFGFNPLYLRIALAVTLLLNAEVAIAAYATCGVAVLVSRLLVRSKRRPVAAAPVLAVTNALPAPVEVQALAA